MTTVDVWRQRLRDKSRVDHTKHESEVRYLGLDLEDALALSEATAI